MRTTPSQSFFPPSASQSQGPWEATIAGELSDRQNDLLGKLTELPRRSKGVIYFDSGGGNVYAGLALASVIRLRGLDVSGVVVGECSSAALLPLAACNRRFVTPHATLLFHPMRWQSDDECRFEEAVEWARHFKVLEEDLDQLLIRMFPISEELLLQWTRPGRFVSGSEFAEQGLAELISLTAGDLWKQTDQTR